MGPSIGRRRCGAALSKPGSVMVCSRYGIPEFRRGGCIASRHSARVPFVLVLETMRALPRAGAALARPKKQPGGL